uniref:Putative defensin-like protein 63 n=1 Tax=Lygus hesperus TaxID=30085 RepID=A0A0A9YYH4_LYGHE
MKRMPKNVPEIRVSAPNRSRREKVENDSHSECAMSDVATDCETLDANYSKRSNAVQGKNEDRDEDVILTDVDGSSDDERETVIRYPIDCINSILDLGMSCEEVSSSQGPNKRQKSITCSLERSKPRTLNADKYDEGGTDVEGVYMSEDEEAYVIDSDNDIQDFEPNAFVSISDKVVTGMIVSPGVTPEPCVGRKKRSSTLSAPIPISSVLTDTEMLISDTESNSTRSRKMTKVKPFRTMFDGFASDTEDSDSSAGQSSKASYKPNRKINCSRSFDNIRNTSATRNNMLAPVRKVEDGSITDTENIYLDDAVAKGAAKNFQSRPSVIRMNKPVQSPEIVPTVRYRHNAVKTKPQSAPPVIINSSKKYNEKTPKPTGFDLNVPIQDDTGNATDVEAFGSDSDDQTDTIKPVAYLPNPKCELIIDNESHKGKMSFILPITESQKGKSMRVDDLDCGYSDVEDLPGFDAEEYFRYPTPELPRTEHSTVQNKEAVIDPSKLRAEPNTREPLTDTEDLDLTQKPISENRLRVKVSNQRKGRGISECHTDVEDLDGSDTESRKIIVCGKASEDADQVELTDVGELSSDDSDDDAIFRFTATTPDLDLNNTYTNARESMSPFSFEVRRKLSETIPQIRTFSPSPIPRNTSTEDFLASQDESAQSNWASDDGQIEAHSSHVNIKLTSKFNIDEAEKLHIKGYVDRPEPTTDVEELTILEALEELRKKRKLQKEKERNEWSSVNVCYSRPKEPSCKPNTRIYKSSRRCERDEESQEGAYGFSDSKTKGTKK